MKIASIVMCAGRSSRLKSDKSKILHEVGGKPLGYWSIKNTLEVTNKEATIVINHQKDKIKEIFTPIFNDKVRFAEQHQLDGTGGAVKAALNHIDDDVQSILVVCGDTPLLKPKSLRQLVTIQKKSHVPIALLSAHAKDPTGYGRIIRNRAQQIIGIVEDKEATPLEKDINEINPGVYVFDAEFLRKNIHSLNNHNSKKEFYLTDLVANYVKNGPRLGPVESVEIPYEEMHGVNDRCQLAHAQKEINRRILQNFMLEGVTFIDPDTTFVDESVEIGKDTIVYPQVHLKGHTFIADNVVIENGAILKDTVVEKNAHIYAYSVCRKAHIGENTHVGPFAHLRPHACLEKNVRVGNFVEVKHSKLQSGSKAAHLAYIGDAHIGENGNIGAGAITCNYDGKNKHKITIGKDSFIGSNSTLISPLEVGENAYIAGGSTITKNVPDNNIAFGRARQITKKSKKNIK